MIGFAAFFYIEFVLVLQITPLLEISSMHDSRDLLWRTQYQLDPTLTAHQQWNMQSHESGLVFMRL